MDLFDNPMVQQARKAMTPEQIAEYERIGEEMYSTVDFENEQILNNANDPLAEPYAYIKELMKSGLQPEDLDESEQKIMENIEGPDWKIKYTIDL
jgi:hypothetical protein